MEIMKNDKNQKKTKKNKNSSNAEIQSFRYQQISISGFEKFIWLKKDVQNLKTEFLKNVENKKMKQYNS